MYDLIIIGGGPAGCSAAVYAARKRLKTLLITEDWGGQSTDSSDIQNWIGTISISGADFGKSLREHVEAYAGDCVDVIDNVKVQSIKNVEESVSVTASDLNTYQSQTVLITSGSRRRKLTIPGAEKFEHKGVTYCASCDGPMFTDKPVVVIGGGNAGFESAAQLQAYVSYVTILQKNENFKADPITVEKVLQNTNVTGITNAEPIEIHGENFVTGVSYKDETDEIREIEANGVFVEIGLIPNTDFVEGLLDMDDFKRIKIDPWNQRTSEKRIWAAGDCTNILYHQNNISSGHAVTALEDIYLYLKAS